MPRWQPTYWFYDLKARIFRPLSTVGRVELLQQAVAYPSPRPVSTPCPCAPLSATELRCYFGHWCGVFRQYVWVNVVGSRSQNLDKAATNGLSLWVAVISLNVEAHPRHFRLSADAIATGTHTVTRDERQIGNVFFNPATFADRCQL